MVNHHKHKTPCRFVAYSRYFYFVINTFHHSITVMERALSRVNNKRGECLTPYSPVIDDCAEVKRLLFRVTYRLASIFSHLTTKAIPDKGSAFNSTFKFTTKSIALLRKEVWLLTLKITLGESI